MIKVKNLTHYYDSDLALQNINVEILKGDFVSIVGQSGSGKSTLLSTLSTLLKPTQGEILIDNQNISNIADIDKFRNTNIGFIFQFHYLINYLSVEENIKLAYNNNLTPYHFDLASKLGIENILHKLPNQISGGQRQRVAILRAVANSPKILFADEPTGNLDTLNSLKVFDIFKQFQQKGMTIVVATHNEHLATYANKTIELTDGTI